MRQYRGIAVETNEWVYGWYFHMKKEAMRGSGIKHGDWEWDGHELHGIIESDMALVNPFNFEGTIHRTAYYRVIPETVGQATGYKDNQWADSYAGDTIRSRMPGDNDSLGQIYYNETYAAFWVIGLDGDYNIPLHRLRLFDIIGNIHQKKGDSEAAPVNSNKCEEHSVTEQAKDAERETE